MVSRLSPGFTTYVTGPDFGAVGTDGAPAMAPAVACPSTLRTRTPAAMRTMRAARTNTSCRVSARLSKLQEQHQQLQPQPSLRWPSPRRRASGGGALRFGAALGFEALE